MKFPISVAVSLIVLSQAAMHREDVSPIEKVLQMMSDLKAKIAKEEATAKALFEETKALCTKKIKTTGFLIKTEESDVSHLTAVIEQESASMVSYESKVEELSIAITTKSLELKKATELREKEAAEYEEQLKELNEIIDTLQRAIAILERSSSASMLQLKGAKSVIDALSVMVQASALSSADAARLTALVQSSEGDEADDSEDSSVGAPAGPVYESKSGGIIDTLEAMLEKAKEQLADLQKEEMKAINEFTLLSQTLTETVTYTKKEVSITKKAIATSKMKYSIAIGDMSATKKALKADVDTKAMTEKECLDAANTFEEESKSRQEEMKALTEAAKAVKEATSLSQISFLQVNRRSKTRSTSLDFQVVHFVRNLAHEHKSAALTQLALRITNVMHQSAARGGDPFGKVKKLITDMISKLEDEGSEEASKKAFCDKELSENKAIKADHEAAIEKMSTEIDAASASLSKLKSEIADIEKSLAEASKEYAEATAIRQEQHDLYKATKAEQEKGLEGVKVALKVLQEYYAKAPSNTDEEEQSAGAGSGIIAMLEVIEADFTKSLSEGQVHEEEAAAAYEAETKQFEIEKAESEADVKYKTKESAELEATISELETDKSASMDGLASVTEYLDKISKQCVVEPESFQDKIDKKNKEIAGLKEALTILDSTVLLQSGKAHRSLRGLSRH